MSNFRKKQAKIKILQRGLIICEGQTEEMYFTGLLTKEDYRRKFAAVSVEIYKPKDHSPRGLVTEAKKRLKEAQKTDPYDFVWIVFDRDGHANVADTFEQALTSKPPIKIAFTGHCFEYFVLLHFVKTTKGYNKCDDIINDIKEYIPDYKKATKIFSTLESHMKTGLINSEWSLKGNSTDLENGKHPYELSSYSNIHELINFLMSVIDVKL